MSKRVYLATRELVFRAKLRAVVEGKGGELTRDAAGADVAVVEIDAAGWEDRVRELVARGVPVIAFGSHVRADLLRRARALGAAAVPNSEVEAALSRAL